MPCNYTGLYDYEAYPELAKFGLVDYDWCDLPLCPKFALPKHSVCIRSNAKRTWVNQSPMDCDGMLVKQAGRNKAQNPTAKVFVYRKRS